MFKVDQDFSQYGEERIILDYFSRCFGGSTSTASTPALMTASWAATRALASSMGGEVS